MRFPGASLTIAFFQLGLCPTFLPTRLFFPSMFMRFDFQHFCLEQGFHGPPNLYLVGSTIHLKGDLVGLLFVKIRLLRNQRPFDDFLKVH
jgi:hypothetical protein